MKKTLAIILSMVLVLCLFTGCGTAYEPKATEAPATEAPAEEAPAEEAPAEEAPAEEAPAEEAPAEEAPAEEAPAEEAPTEEVAEETAAEELAVPLMTFAEFTEAEADTSVAVESYIQAKQAYAAEYGNTSLYLQGEDGAYFVYRIPCTAEEYDKFVPGAKVRITGYKSEWAGEVEIADAMFELLDGTYTAEAEDVTALLADEEALKAHMNEFVAFKGMKVEAVGDNGEAFFYNWDNSGEEGNDLYFKVSLDGAEFSFVVESDLCPAGSETYEAVKALKVGETVDMEGFLYWYEGANPHITSVVVTAEAPVEENTEKEAAAPQPGASKFLAAKYQKFLAADVDTEVTVISYIQAKQAYSAEYGNTSLYLQDDAGAYFVYRLPCTAEEYEQFEIGQKIKVKGFKSEWAGEVEVADATFQLMEGSYIAEAEDVTDLIADENALREHMNEFVAFKGMTVEPSGENGAAFLYNWDGSGEEGNDLYFKVSLDGAEYTFTVESDLCGAGTEVYEAVKALEVGQVIDIEGFLYWYEGANPHVTAVAAA